MTIVTLVSEGARIPPYSLPIPPWHNSSRSSMLSASASIPPTTQVVFAVLELSDLCVKLELVVVTFDAKLWLWDARRLDTWTFVTLPAEVAEDIRDLAAGPRRGFGSVRVRVTVGKSTWTTSIFPDSERGSFVLPIKRAVRQAEDLDVGDIATVTVEVIGL